MKTNTIVIIVLVVVAIVVVYFVFFKDKKASIKGAPGGGKRDDLESTRGWLKANWETLQKIGNLPDPPPKGFTSDTYAKANDDQKGLIDKSSFEWLENIASGARAKGIKMAAAIDENIDYLKQNK